MAPSVTVLQLDTDFPRVAGDVGCEQTYLDDIQIIRIPNATVGQIVSADPAAILADLVDWCERDHFDDDLTVLVIRRAAD